MSSKKIILLILLSSTVAINLSAESVSLGPIVSVDVRDVDYTIQALPEVDIEEDSICLWDGDEILTFSMPEQEEHDGTLEEYRKAFVYQLGKIGGSEIDLDFRKTFRSPSGLNVHAYTIDFIMNDEPSVQLIYMIQLKGWMHFTTFPLMDPSTIAEVSVRTDAIMITAKKNQF